MAYTHDVKFKVKNDGSMYIEAEMGQDPATKDITYRLTSTSEPLRDDLLSDFLNFSKEFKLLMDKYKGVREVSVKEK